MKNIVTVGGGTGSYGILSGLKHLDDVSLTALVSMADNGGSTGVLRDELGVLPPGDVRQCLVALSEHSDIVRKLMSYRFTEGGLSGHNFGNILLAALEKVTGDFAEGVEIASEILKVKGTVVPVTKNKADLCIKLKDGSVIQGEDAANHAHLQDVGIEDIYYKDKVVINERARRALIEADCIILGPGNFYCSVMPNIIVEGFTEIIKDVKAKIVLPVNLTNKQGHTLGWGVSEYVKVVEEYLGRRVDLVLINNESPTDEQVTFYKIEEGDGVLVMDDFKDERARRYPLLSHTLIKHAEGDAISGLRSFIRHDSLKIAECIKDIL